MSAPTWRAIPGWVGLYEASDDGQIRSLDRVSFGRPRKGRVLKPAPNAKGYLVVVFCRDGVRTGYGVHNLIARTFHGEPAEPGLHARHKDDDPSNNRADNIVWGTPSENERDKVAHGRNPNAAKTHCSADHEFTPENTRVNAKGWRSCRACHRERNRLARARAQRNPASQQVAA